MFSGRCLGIAQAGFPIRVSPDITPAHGSPRLIAVYHALLQLLTPRHPPYALSSLTKRDAEKLKFTHSSKRLECLYFCSVVKVLAIPDLPETAPALLTAGRCGLSPSSSRQSSTLHLSSKTAWHTSQAAVNRLSMSKTIDYSIPARAQAFGI